MVLPSMRGSLRVILAASAALAPSVGCSPPSPNTDAGRSATDIFVRAAEGVPGGALLAAWVPSLSERASAEFPSDAYLAGGFVGVDPAQIQAPHTPGRLMTYDGNGTFATACRAPTLLRAVHGEQGVVYAAGDGRTVLRHDRRTGSCETLEIPASVAADATIYGIEGSGAGDAVYFVGASSSMGRTSALLVRYNGSAFESVAVPAEAAGVTLRSVSYTPETGFWAVGDQATTLRLAPGASAWTYERAPVGADDTDLRAVSVLVTAPRYWAMVVGGTSRPIVLARRVGDTAWDNRVYPELERAGIYAVHSAAEVEIFMGGRGGQLMVFTGAPFYVAPQRLTTHDILGINGSSGLIIGVGGDVENRTGSQSAVILIRGDSVERGAYVVDGVTHTPVGRLRLEFGGAASQ